MPLTQAPSTTPTRFWAVIACAGAGLRAGGAAPKQYAPIAGKPLVLHTLAAFVACVGLSATVVVVARGDSFFDAHPASGAQLAKVGGATRAQSVLAGLDFLCETCAATDADWVLVHDAARCLITPAQIRRLIAACENDAVGGLLAQPLSDTLKQAQAGRVSATLSREAKWLAQTPQMFRLGVLRTALQNAGPDVTDEASAMEAAGFAPLLVAAQGPNLKVTYPEDFALAEAILRSRQA